MDGSRNVFIIDNASSPRKSLSRLLKIAGFNVKSFASVVDFLDVAKEGIHGCLIMDLSISGMFTEELIEEINEYEKGLKIIIISTYDDQETKKIAKDIGAIEFFRKPVDGYALIDVINWALTNYHLFDNHSKIKKHDNKDEI